VNLHKTHCHKQDGHKCNEYVIGFMLDLIVLWFGTRYGCSSHKTWRHKTNCRKDRILEKKICLTHSKILHSENLHPNTSKLQLTTKPPYTQGSLNWGSWIGDFFSPQTLDSALHLKAALKSNRMRSRTRAYRILCKKSSMIQS
jgi:hypothetical protein